MSRNSPRSRRAAFSLAELVISIGILILMMALAGQVFSITIKSTGQATALTEVTQQLRVLEETLREDLRNVQPGQSLMLIQGNPVNAYWTQAGKEADDDGKPDTGYGHIRDLEREKLKADGTPDLAANGYEKMVEPRADILMFFTARKATSAVNPAVSSRLQQVVYGHAEMADYQPNASTPGTYDMVPDMVADPTLGNFPVDSTNLYPVLASSAKFPANQWHLSRRSVLVLPVPRPTPSPNDPIRLDDRKFLESQDDLVWNFSYDQLVLKPQLIGTNYVGAPWFLPQIFGNVSLAYSTWYKPFLRSRMDPTPPMMMSNRMGAFFLPNCASFKVEWALDPRSLFVSERLNETSDVFWIDQGDVGDSSRLTFKGPDPLYSLQKRIDDLKSKSDAVSKSLKAKLESLMCEQTQHEDGSTYSLADRFRGVTCDVSGKPPSDPTIAWPKLDPTGLRPNTAVFTASRPHVDTGELTPDDIWPGALRITVDLYDREGRLERPIRHVMIIPIGG